MSVHLDESCRRIGPEDHRNADDLKHVLAMPSRRRNGPTAPRWLDEDEMFAALAVVAAERAELDHLEWFRNNIERNRHRRLVVVPS